MERIIYFRRLPRHSDLDRIKQRFHLSPITVNGISHAVIDDGDVQIFNKCVQLGFFEVRNQKKNK